MSQVMQQKRAKYALQQVKKAKDNPEVNAQEFKSRASELPFMIRANGLGQALAFFKSKGREHGYKNLYDILSQWLCSSTEYSAPFSGYSDALDGIVASDRKTYMVAQTEAIMFMGWVKKFATAFLDGEE